MEREGILRRLEETLSRHRYLHTLGVAFTAAALAMAYGEDVDRAETAGLLHDCAKGMSAEKMTALCLAHGEEISEAEHRAPALLHAKAGVILAREEYGVCDEEILSAIRWHTTGRPQMTRLEQLLFVADYIEPGRVKAPRLAEIRREAFHNPELAMLFILQDTLAYLQSTGEAIDSQTEKARAYYEKIIA